MKIVPTRWWSSRQQPVHFLRMGRWLCALKLRSANIFHILSLSLILSLQACIIRKRDDRYGYAICRYMLEHINKMHFQYTQYIFNTLLIHILNFMPIWMRAWHGTDGRMDEWTNGQLVVCFGMVAWILRRLCVCVSVNDDVCVQCVYSGRWLSMDAMQCDTIKSNVHSLPDNAKKFFNEKLNVCLQLGRIDRYDTPKCHTVSSANQRRCDSCNAIIDDGRRISNTGINSILGFGQSHGWPCYDIVQW